MMLLLLTLLSLVDSATMALDAGMLDEYNRRHKNAGSDMQALLDMYDAKSTCAYCFQGAPNCTKGPCSEVMGHTFVEVLSHEGSSFYSADFDYLIAVHDTTTYRFSNFMTTHLGCKALFTGIATTTFNEDSKIVDHIVMSLDAPQVLKCIGEFYESKQKEAAKKEDGGGEL
jgi:hypothetical protein